MSVRHETVTVETKRREDTIDITPRVKAAVTRAKIAEGIVVVTVAHTTAAVFVNEGRIADVFAPGRYTLTLKAGDLRRTVRFRIRG